MTTVDAAKRVRHFHAAARVHARDEMGPLERVVTGLESQAVSARVTKQRITVSNRTCDNIVYFHVLQLHFWCVFSHLHAGVRVLTCLHSVV